MGPWGPEEAPGSSKGPVRGPWAPQGTRGASRRRAHKHKVREHAVGGKMPWWAGGIRAQHVLDKADEQFNETEPIPKWGPKPLNET